MWKLFLIGFLVIASPLAADEQALQDAAARLANLYRLPNLERREDFEKTAKVIIDDLDNTALLKFDATRTRIDVLKASNVIQYLISATKDDLLSPETLFAVAQKFDFCLKHVQTFDDRAKHFLEVRPDFFKDDDVARFEASVDKAKEMALEKAQNFSFYLELLQDESFEWKRNPFLSANGRVAVETSSMGEGNTLEGIVVELYRKKYKEFLKENQLDNKKATKDTDRWLMDWLDRNGAHLVEAIDRSTLNGKRDHVYHNHLDKLGRILELIKKSYPNDSEWYPEYQKWFQTRNYLEDLYYRSYSKSDPRYLFYVCRRKVRRIANAMSVGSRE